MVDDNDNDDDDDDWLMGTIVDHFTVQTEGNWENKRQLFYPFYKRTQNVALI